MRIAKARRSDVGPITSLMTASPLLERYRVRATAARGSITEALRARDIVLVAKDGGAVIGLAWIVPTRAFDRSAYLRLLLVAEGRQSDGIGAALLARGEREARARGSRHLLLLVTRTNSRARAFYRRHGYAHVGDLRDFVRPGVDESIYAKGWRARG